METLEYRTFDKSTWGPGPWQDEADKKQWLDEATGYPCLIVRSPSSGSLCGYVGVPEAHPFYGKGYGVLPDDPEVHGGLTFAGSCRVDADESKHVCHKAGGDDKVWWLGFDTAHCGDYSPKIDAVMKSVGHYYGDLGDTYKDFDYVTREVIDLAAQLKHMAHATRDRE